MRVRVTTAEVEERCDGATIDDDSRAGGGDSGDLANVGVPLRNTGRDPTRRLGRRVVVLTTPLLAMLGDDAGGSDTADQTDGKQKAASHLKLSG